MAVCFFNKDYDKSFECEYLINDKGIEVIVNYDIDDEIEPDNNGVITFGKNTKFNEQDILIIDYQNKIKINCTKHAKGVHFCTPITNKNKF